VADPGREQESAGRRVALRAAALIAVILIVSVLCARAILSRVPNEAANELRRVLDTCDRSVVVLGGSMALAAVSAEELDAHRRGRGIEGSSLVVGVDGATPNVLRLLARRFRRACAEEHRRPEAIFIELAPHMTTSRMRATSGEMESNAIRIVELVELRDFLRFLRTSRDEAERTFVLWLFGGRSAATFMPKVTNQLLPRSRAPDSERARTERFRVWLTKGYDALDLEFDEALIEELVDAVRELQAITPNVYVLVLPRNPTFKPSALGTERLQQVLARLTRELHVQVIDLFAADGFTPGDFADPVHLNEAGRAKSTQWLAHRLTALQATNVGVAGGPASSPP
jgi:hypothetical protein